MKSIVFILTFAVIGVFLPNFGRAQENADIAEIPVDVIENPVIKAYSSQEKAAMNPFGKGAQEDVLCEGVYPLGLVDLNYKASVEKTVPGANVTFTGSIRNDNSFPITQGVFIARVYKKVNASQGSLAMVEQFNIASDLRLNAFEERKIPFDWHVPEDLAQGEYFLSLYLANDEQLLAGFYFDDTLQDEKIDLSVETDQKGGVYIDRSQSKFGSQVLTGKSLQKTAEDAQFEVVLVNPKSEPQDIQLTWKEYKTSDLLESNLLNDKIELINLGPNETKKVVYSVEESFHPALYVVASVKGQYQKSIERVHILDSSQIGVLAIAPVATDFPFRAGEEVTIKTCIYAENIQKNPGVQASLSVYNRSNNELLENISLDIDSEINFHEHTFIPKEIYDDVVLKLQVTDDKGNIIDKKETLYSCEALSGGACVNKEVKASPVALAKKTFTIFAFLIPIFVFIILYFKKMNKRNRFRVLIFVFVSTAGFFLSIEVSQAAVLQTHWKYAGPKSNIINISRYSQCDAGWTYTNLMDDNDNALRHLGEEDTDGGLTQLCIKADDPAITLQSEWTTGSCPAGTSFAGVYDDAGRANWWNDDAYHVHNTNEEDFRPDNSNAYRWCLGASGGGATEVQTRWVEWASSTYNPPCAFDETQIVATHRKGSNYSNNNLEDRAGTNQRSLCGKIIVVNRPPLDPSLSGPTNGLVGVNQIFNTVSTDPDGNAIEYGIDWNNNGSVDQWTAALSSGTAATPGHIWISAGTYTLRTIARDTGGALSGWSNPWTITITPPVDGVCGLANNLPTTNPPTIGLCNGGTPTAVTPGAAPGPYSWTCTGSGGGSNAACSAPYLSPAPNFNFQINGVVANNSLTVARNANLNIIWNNVTNATSCSGTGNSWTGAKAIAGGSDNISASAASLYQLSCTGPGGTATKQISVTIQPTLKICQNSCSGGIEPPASFSMNRFDTRNLVACFNDAASCTNATGDVTTSATWTEGGGNPVSLGGSSPKTLTADNVGTESIQATYSGNTVTRSVTVTCTDSGACQRDSRSQSLCQKDNFTVVDNCGVTENCTGEKTCDYNWREVEP